MESYKSIYSVNPKGTVSKRAIKEKFMSSFKTILKEMEDELGTEIPEEEKEKVEEQVNEMVADLVKGENQNVGSNDVDELIAAAQNLKAVAANIGVTASTTVDQPESAPISFAAV